MSKSIVLNGVNVSEQSILDAGYVKKFEYPIYMQSRNSGGIVRFTGLREGIVMKRKGNGVLIPSDTHKDLVPHTDTEVWTPYLPHEHLKLQYAEDAKLHAKPWLLWEFKSFGDKWLTADVPPLWRLETTYRRKANTPELYDGLTEAQWKEVMAKGWLCEFWDDSINRDGSLQRLRNLNTSLKYKFMKLNNCCWKHCRIHESQPQFGTGKRPEGLDDDSLVTVRTKEGWWGCVAARDVDWTQVKYWQRCGV